ncbi:MAG TPA: hypothetical protein PLX59_02355 [Candidatus Cloacimonadota bacterium]|nr:hypothetical protein [Candidatus Cloacimonadota bacterium]
MKHKYLLLLLLLLLAAGLNALGVGKALLFSDSFMLRARGSEALYYNPALINERYTDVYLPGVNLGFYVNNNSLDLDTYNFVMARDSLTTLDKEYILSRMEKSLSASTEAHASIFGLTVGNVGLASTFHLYGTSSVSRQYLELLLYGNQDSLYVFTKEDNHLSALSFIDLTLGMGDFRVPLPEGWDPNLRVGFSASLLVGIEDLYTNKFDGRFASGFDGLSLHQNIEMHTGVLGGGFKGMLGAVAEPMPNLKLGFTVDNILGGIRWGLDTKGIRYSLDADSVYVAQMEEDFFTEEDETYDISSYTTEFPLEFRLAGMYTMGHSSLSADWVLPSGESALNFASGKLSLGAEINPLKHFPVHLGMSFGNSKVPFRFSLGAGVMTSFGDIGLGFQSFDSLLPGSSSKGISLGTYFNFTI